MNESHSVTSDSLQRHGLYSPWNSPGQKTGVGSLSLLQRIFPTQESIWGLLHFKRILYQLSYHWIHLFCAKTHILMHSEQLSPPFKNILVGFLGGSVVTSPPAHAGDMGSIPGPRRSHLPQSSYVCVPEPGHRSS